MAKSNRRYPYLPVGLWPRFVSAFFLQMGCQMNTPDVETNPKSPVDWSAIHGLLRLSFRSMEGRIDPPSSLRAMSPDTLRIKAETEDLFLIRAGTTPIACLFGHGTPPVYRLSKLAVHPDHARRGLARRLIDTAVRKAAGTCTTLRLQTRIELVENHATFRALGFSRSGSSSHPGFDRPTSVIFTRPIAAG